jgi:topoisomerase IA-like protein
MATYGKKAGDKVERAMHEKKEGTLKSGRSGKKVTSRKQAIAIGLSEARKEGAKVPAKKGAAKKSSAGKTTAKKGTARKTPAKKTARKSAKKSS